MLRLAGGQVESLFDEVLPTEVRELPEDLAKLDLLLADAALLAPIERAWAESARNFGRPTIAMATYVRLMVTKQRTGWGYETLVREVSDSIHLRRFCLIALTERVPDESTVRKLTRRLGAEVVAEITRCVIAKAQRETRFRARAVRIDSTVVEADVRYPSDAVLALQGAQALAREGRKLRALVGDKATRVRDRSRQVGETARAISRTLARRAGRDVKAVLELNRKAGEAMSRSVREARRLAAQARQSERARQRRREHAPAADGRRAQATEPETAGGRARRRLRAAQVARAARADRSEAVVRLRPRGAGLAQDAQAARALPNRRRGPHQPPQAQLRAAPRTPQRLRGPAGLDRLGDPHL